MEGLDRADQPLGHPDGRARSRSGRGPSSGPGPVAALAQHVDQAGHAGELRPGSSPVRHSSRAVSSAASARAVVGAVVEDQAEALVELRGHRGQVVLQRQREPGPHGLEAVLGVAALGPGDALQPQRPRAQVARPAARPRARPRARGRSPACSARARAQVVRPPRGARRRRPRRARGGERVRRQAAGGQRGLAVAASARAPRRAAARRRPASSRADVGPQGADLAPGAAPPRLSSPESSALFAYHSRVAMRPSRPRPRARARAPRGRPGRRRGGRARRGPPRPRAAAPRGRGRVAGPIQWRRDLEARGRPGLERLGHAAVEGPPPEPGHVGVERLARERVPEGAASRALLARSGPRSSSSPRASSPASPATISRSNASPATAATSAARAPPRESSEAPISTASRTVSGTGTCCLGELEPGALARRGGHGAAPAASSSTKKGTPWVRSWIAREERRGASPRSCPTSAAVPRGPGAPGRARPAGRRGAGRAAAVGAGARAAGRPSGTRRRPAPAAPRAARPATRAAPASRRRTSGGRPGPRAQAVAGEVREGVAHRLEERRAGRRRGPGSPSSGRIAASCGAQRPAPVQGIRCAAQARAERGDDGAVRPPSRGSRPAPEHDAGGRRRRAPREAGLADARLAGQEHERAAGRAGVVRARASRRVRSASRPTSAVAGRHRGRV